MNKRYIDFVPTAKTAEAGPKVKKSAVRQAPKAKAIIVMPGKKVLDVAPRKKTVPKKKATPVEVTSVKKAAPVKKSTPVKQVASVKQSVPRKVNVSRGAIVSNKMRAATFTDEKKPKPGEIEDLSRHFVKTEVAKRPLSEPATRPKFSFRAKVQKKEAKKATPEAEPEKRLIETYKTPKSPFINQGNIEKRPLSKTVYTKKVVVPKEKKQEPVTIITKPEKQSHAGVIVAVILTIILGAAAGTVAFLLLPK